MFKIAARKPWILTLRVFIAKILQVDDCAIVNTRKRKTINFVALKFPPSHFPPPIFKGGDYNFIFFSLNTSASAEAWKGRVCIVELSVSLVPSKKKSQFEYVKVPFFFYISNVLVLDNILRQIPTEYTKHMHARIYISISFSIYLNFWGDSIGFRPQLRWWLWWWWVCGCVRVNFLLVIVNCTC